ncbi:hypothetical protein D9O50_16095 [Oxalobacteraceae bacterium CAVE-383]|nr:hypothetical protein D9O50_16095 [Oxalobacteraceae bacterium CAVE-383]
MFDEKIAPLADAIRSRTSLKAIYKSEPREFSPHALGKGRYGEDVVLVYQYAGMSGGRPTAGLPPERCWRMFVLEDLRDLSPADGGWHSHESYQAAQERLTGISIAIEMETPQQPPAFGEAAGNQA